MSEPRKLDLQAEVARLASITPVPRPLIDQTEAQRHKAELEEYRKEGIMHGWCHAIPRRFHTAKLRDLAGESAETLAQLQDWADDPQDRNLVLLGPVGTGKTHVAVAVAKVRYFNYSESIAFWPVVELLDELRPGGREGVYDEARLARVLILDDLGAERPTEWTAERLYALVNRRWLERYPTIATTNLPGTRKSAPEGYEGPTLEETLGPRMFSRLVGSGAVIVRLSGPDRRR